MNESKDNRPEQNARSKVKDNWNSVWNAISIDPRKRTIDDIEMSRSLKAHKSIKHLCKHLDKKLDQTKVITKENTLKLLAKKRKIQHKLNGKHSPIDRSKEISEDNSKDIFEVNSKDISEVNSKDISEVNSKDISEVNSKDISEVNSKDISEVNPKDISEVNSEDNSKDTSEVNSKDISEDNTKNICEDISKDNTNESLKQKSKELKTEVKRRKLSDKDKDKDKHKDTANGKPTIDEKLQKYPKAKSEAQLMAKKKVNILRGLKSLKNKPIIKRNRIKPVVVKNLTESKSFLEFVSQKFQPIKEGVPFIQDRSCKELTKNYESSQLNHCMDCNEKRSQSQTCRFFQYRTVIKNGDQLSVYAFAEELNATHYDCQLWLPMRFHTTSNTSTTNLDPLTAKYLLIFVGPEFCRIYKEEQQMAHLSRPSRPTWKKPVKGIRELCDNCETTIFNTHYVCSNCGLAVCFDCFSRRSSLPKTSSVVHNTRHRNRDEFGWLLCKDKQSHDLKAFHLAVFITKAVFDLINNTYHLVRNLLGIKGKCECNQLSPQLNVDMRQIGSEMDLKHYQEQVHRQWMCEDRLLILKDPKCADNIKLFQIFWLKGFPVLIEKVNQSLDYNKLWNPKNFNNHFGKQNSRLVNCMNGQILPKQPMSNFWDGFEDVDQRLFDETNEEMILKLKDWPPNAEFRDMLPMWFDDLQEALPLQEYTRYNGSRNLAARLPEFFVRPDLGPKMYCAYGSVLHPDKGTTNLHLDMSDAVNVMIYVGVATKDGKPLQSHLNGADDTLLKGGCDPEMMTRANSAELKVGALWHIWKAEDSDKIRLFLNKVAKERNIKIEANNDPIHDQSWYLDETLRTRLEDEHNVRGLAIAQCLGDAILVPAGAPHQVQNIHSCIKVAGEFVSPENVFHCLAMTQQFRNLSKRHNNHEDKLQIKNIIYHTIKDSLSALLSTNPMFSNDLQPPPPPPQLLSVRPAPKSNNLITCNLPPLQPKHSPNIQTNSLEPTLETISSNSQENCESNRNLFPKSNELENCKDVSPLETTPHESNDSVDLKINDLLETKPNTSIDSESFKTESDLNQMQTEEKASTSESPLSPPPLLTPYYETNSDVHQTKGCSHDSTQTTIEANN